MSVEKARPAESTAQTVRPKRDWRSSRPISIHFRAAAVAAMLAIGLLCVSVKYSHRLAKRAIHARGWEYSIKKNQGIAWQKAAFAEPDLLPLYGSSELIKPAAGEAYLFFKEHPSGFVVSICSKKSLPPARMRRITSWPFAFHRAGFLGRKLTVVGMRAIFQRSRPTDSYSAAGSVLA
jgi:hypothetical protein